MAWGLPGSSVHGILQARTLEWVVVLLQGIFPTQGSNPGLLHCRQILYLLNHQGSGQGANKREASQWKAFVAIPTPLQPNTKEIASQYPFISVGQNGELVFLPTASLQRQVVVL